MKGMIFDVKEMAVHDGPGIRTTVFFKGCPLRCKWCHNPDGFSSEKQLFTSPKLCTKCGCCHRTCAHEECRPFGRCIFSCPGGLLKITGRDIGAHKLADELLQGAKILGDSFGGFTFSGGEPLLQWEFLIELASELKGYHLAIETSGYAEKGVFRKVIDKMDLVIMDIKIADSELHRLYTGQSNELILENFEELKKSGKAYIIRTPLIPGITDTEENLKSIEKLIGKSNWEQLPYNSMAGAKYASLGLKYEL